MKHSAVLIILICLMLAACALQAANISPTNATTLTPTATLNPTPTEWLPFDPSIYQDNNDAQICSIPYIPTLSKEQAANLSPVQIASELFILWLNHYTASNTPKLCRLLDYRLEAITTHPYQSGVIIAHFSVQIAQVPSNWVAADGTFEPQGWVTQKRLNLSVGETPIEYTLTILGGP